MVIYKLKATFKSTLLSVNSFDAKNNEKQDIFTTPKTTVKLTLRSINLFYAKPMKTRLYSL